MPMEAGPGVEVIESRQLSQSHDRPLQGSQEAAAGTCDWRRFEWAGRKSTLSKVGVESPLTGRASSGDGDAVGCTSGVGIDVADLRGVDPLGVEWTTALVEPALRSVVDRLPVSVQHVAGYHFGWCDEAGRPDVRPAGKLFRSRLTLLCAQAVGAEAERALDAAVAVELVHNFSLLHDDVMDGDTLRRHRPTVWAVFGKPVAILVGDALLVQAFAMLAPAAGSIGVLAGALQELVQGQAQDLAFEGRTDVSLAECIEMAGGKTAALLRCAAELGASHGGGSPASVRALARCAWHLGMAFQLRDDLLGIWGDPRVTGKPNLADLRVGKKSLPVVAALASGGSATRRLAELYLRPEPLSGAELLAAADLVDQAGGRAWAKAEARRQIDAALVSLAAAEPSPKAAAKLAALAQAVIQRDE